MTAIVNKKTDMEEEEGLYHDHKLHTKKDDDKVSVAESSSNKDEEERTYPKTELSQPSEEDVNGATAPAPAPARRRMDQLSPYGGKSIWLLVYIAIVTTWPLVGSALLVFLKRKFKNALPAALLSR